MEPPKCRLCGEKHYGLAHIFNKKSASVKQKPEPEPLAHGHDAQARALAGTHEITRTSEKPPFDRNKYQRELMRKRRAEAKVKRNAAKKK